MAPDADQSGDEPWMFVQNVKKVFDDWKDRRVQEGRPATREEKAEFRAFWQSKREEALELFPDQPYLCRWYAEGMTWKHYGNHANLEGFRARPVALTSYQIEHGDDAVDPRSIVQTGSSTAVTPAIPSGKETAAKKAAEEDAKKAAMEAKARKQAERAVQLAQEALDKAKEAASKLAKFWTSGSGSSSAPTTTYSAAAYKPAPPPQESPTSNEGPKPWEGLMAPERNCFLDKKFDEHQFCGSLTLKKNLDGSPRFCVRALKPDAYKYWTVDRGLGLRSVEDFTELSFKNFTYQSVLNVFVQPRYRQELTSEVYRKLELGYKMLQEWARTSVERRNKNGRGTHRVAIDIDVYFMYWMGQNSPGWKEKQFELVPDRKAAWNQVWNLRTDHSPSPANGPLNEGTATTTAVAGVGAVNDKKRKAGSADADSDSQDHPPKKAHTSARTISADAQFGEIGTVKKETGALVNFETEPKIKEEAPSETIDVVEEEQVDAKSTTKAQRWADGMDEDEVGIKPEPLDRAEHLDAEEENEG